MHSADIIASWMKFVFSGSEKSLRKNFCQKLPAAYPVCTDCFLFMSRPLSNGPFSYSQCGQIQWRETLGSWLSQQRGKSKTTATGMTRHVFWEYPIVMPILSSSISLHPHSVLSLDEIRNLWGIFSHHVPGMVGKDRERWRNDWDRLFRSEFLPLKENKPVFSLSHSYFGGTVSSKTQF